jgi:CBS domain-containing protein
VVPWSLIFIENKIYDMKQRSPISTIMTKNVITLNSTDTLEKAERLFKKNKIRHIPVVSGDKIIGMLSYTDLLRISFADAVYDDEDEVETTVYNMFSIEQVMAKNLIHVNSNTTIKEVAEILSKKEFHAIPVVDDGKLMGIVTTTDLINYLLKQF